MADKQNPAPQEPVRQAAAAPAPAPVDASVPRFPEGEEAVSEYERRKARAEEIDQARAEEIRAGEDPRSALEKARSKVETRDKGRAPENR